MGAFDAVRAVIDWIEAQWEGLVLARDPEFMASLHEADDDLRTGQTTSAGALRAELESDDRHLAL